MKLVTTMPFFREFSKSKSISAILPSTNIRVTNAPIPRPTVENVGFSVISLSSQVGLNVGLATIVGTCDEGLGVGASEKSTICVLVGLVVGLSDDSITDGDSVVWLVGERELEVG